jgi:nicotinamidase-related amidase
MSSNAIYLVMDMINDLVHEEGPSSSTGIGRQAQARDVVANTAGAIRAARESGIRVGFVRIGFSTDYRECSPTSRRFSSARELGLFKLQTWGSEIHPALSKKPEDPDFIKRRVSPFYGTDLELVLRVMKVEVVYVSGVSTNGVVHSAARDLHDLDFKCVVLEDCCSASSKGEHECAILCIESFADVSTSRIAFP